jgi:hypothetical protein
VNFNLAAPLIGKNLYDFIDELGKKTSMSPRCNEVLYHAREHLHVLVYFHHARKRPYIFFLLFMVVIG